jgi:ABC-type enterobactin transport system permease subunit
MAMPPTHQLCDLGPQAQMMARNCTNERLAMVLQCVAVGSMIIMAGAAASHFFKDAFGSPAHDYGHGRSK